MIKNYSISEALKIITIGKDLKAIEDIGQRFPLFMFFVLHNPLKIIESFETRVSVETINKQLKANLGGVSVYTKKQPDKLKSKNKEEVKTEEIKENDLNFDIEDLLEKNQS